MLKSKKKHRPHIHKKKYKTAAVEIHFLKIKKKKINKFLKKLVFSRWPGACVITATNDDDDDDR